MVGSMKFEDKRTCLPLQVADTLAYECREHLELMLVDPKTPIRPERKRLTDVRKIFKISLCENKCLEEYLNNYTGPNP
jgi:hypothetical protein